MTNIICLTWYLIFDVYIYFNLIINITFLVEFLSYSTIDIICFIWCFISDKYFNLIVNVILLVEFLSYNRTYIIYVIGV